MLTIHRFYWLPGPVERQQHNHLNNSGRLSITTWC